MRAEGNRRGEMKLSGVKALSFLSFLVLIRLLLSSNPNVWMLSLMRSLPPNSDPLSIAVKDANTLSQITVIMLGMARICSPSISLFRQVWQTHEEHLEGFSSVRRIVVLDGFGDARLDEKDVNVTDFLDAASYSEFKKRLRAFLAEKRSHDSGPIDVLELDDHGGLLGSMKAALEMVQTTIVYVTQDDLALTHNVPTVGVVETMLGCLKGMNPVRFVLLNKRRNGYARRIDDFFGEWELGNTTIANEKVLSGAPNQSITVDPGSIHVPMLRTKRWSDNNHFAFKKDYVDVLIPKANGQKKWVDPYIQGHLWTHPEDWIHYGTHILGEQTEQPYIYHYNGRNPDMCNETFRTEQYESWMNQIQNL